MNYFQFYKNIKCFDKCYYKCFYKYLAKSLSLGRYEKQSISIEKNRIIVTIPFQKIKINELDPVDSRVSHKVDHKVDYKLNNSQSRIVAAIRDNPNITTNQLMVITGLSEPGVKRT